MKPDPADTYSQSEGEMSGRRCGTCRRCGILQMPLPAITYYCTGRRVKPLLIVDPARGVCNIWEKDDD